MRTFAIVEIEIEVPRDVAVTQENGALFTKALHEELTKTVKKTLSKMRFLPKETTFHLDVEQYNE